MPAGSLRVVDTHLLVEAEADDHMRVAEHFCALPVHVNDSMAREPPEQRSVLVKPPRRGVAGKQVHVAAEPAGGDEQRDEHVGEVVEHVALIATTDREDHRGGGALGHASRNVRR